MKKIFFKLAIALCMLPTFSLLHAVGDPIAANQNLALKFDREKLRQRVLALKAEARNLLDERRAGQNVDTELKEIQNRIVIKNAAIDELSNKINEKEDD